MKTLPATTSAVISQVFSAGSLQEDKLPRAEGGGGRVRNYSCIIELFSDEHTLIRRCHDFSGVFSSSSLQQGKLPGEGMLPIMANTGRLRPNGVPLSGI